MNQFELPPLSVNFQISALVSNLCVLARKKRVATGGRPRYIVVGLDWSGAFPSI
jgi:hypothetical protein